MIDVGQAAHERCTPWADRPFPFADLTRRLRSLRARLRRGLFAVDATLAFLERAEARWPRDALAILARTRRWQARLEERLRALGLTPRA